MVGLTEPPGVAWWFTIQGAGPWGAPVRTINCALCWLHPDDVFADPGGLRAWLESQCYPPFEIPLGMSTNVLSVLVNDLNLVPFGETSTFR